jgi:Polyketide cyclase / dehydrase and lipid transport
MADLRESLTVAAPADLVYDLIADLPRMGEWSPECERATWRGGATCASEGAQFVGHNRAGSVRWITQGEVVIAERGRHLAFEISFGPLKIARWEYAIVPEGADLSSCTVAEEWTDRRPLWYRTPADMAFGSRLKINQRGMVETLSGLRLAAETVAKTQPRG